MALKLLQKSDIQRSKSIERQQTVEEGMKLAKRVDGLREAAAQEEAALSMFRTETLSQIQEEIQEATNRRDGLLGEVSDLEEKRAVALIPLDEEAKRIQDAEGALNLRQTALDSYASVLEIKNSTLDSRTKTVERLESIAKQAEHNAQILFANASTVDLMAEKKDRLADETLKEAQRKSAEVMSGVLQRQEWVSEREKAALEKEERLRKKEIELEKEWSLLKDRKEMFIKLSKTKHGD